MFFRWLRYAIREWNRENESVLLFILICGALLSIVFGFMFVVLASNGAYTMLEPTQDQMKTRTIILVGTIITTVPYLLWFVKVFVRWGLNWFNDRKRGYRRFKDIHS